MKRICFGTLLQLMYQGRSQGVTYKSICSAIFEVYGCAGMEHRDKSLPGHLKTGHDNVPPDVINAARDISFENAIIAYEKGVVSLIAEPNQVIFVHAVKEILRDDPADGNVVLGYVKGFEKDSILSKNKFMMAPLLASLFRYAIVDISNHDCEANLKDFEANYLSMVDTSEQIFIDPLEEATEVSEDSTPLEPTLIDGTFSQVFKKIDSVVVAGISHPSTAEIYCADLNNGKFRFAKVKNFLADNIGTYVFSRSKLNSFQDMKKPIGAIGTQALIQFQKAYGANAETTLGELLLYVFLEKGLNAPKILSKLEFSQGASGLQSRSDGIHLLATTEHGRPFNQLVFGSSDISGNLVKAIDRAFERILDIEEHADLEFSTVEKTTQHFIFDSKTSEYILDIMIPRKQYRNKPDMAFGMLLGYTLEVDPSEKDSAQYRVAAERQMKADIVAAKDYIAQKMVSNHLEGYSFYCYVLPFNDAPGEKTKLIDEMLKGEY